MLSFSYLLELAHGKAWTNIHSYLKSKQNEVCRLHYGLNAFYQEKYCESLIQYPTAQTVSGNPQLYHPTLFTCPSSGLFYLRNAKIFHKGYVQSPEGQFFSDLTYTTRDQGRLDKIRLKSILNTGTTKQLEGWYANITYPLSTHYYHWIVESLPRLHFISDYIQSLQGIFIPKGLLPVMREPLYYFGFQEKQLIELEESLSYEVEHLLIPNYCSGLNVPYWVKSFFRSNSFSEYRYQQSIASKKIYISRSDASCRRMINEKDIIPLLESAGFQVLSLTGKSFSEYIQLFSSASTIVGIHGAGLTHIVFSNPGVKILEIQPHASFPPHVYHSLASIVGGQYFYINGEQENRCNKNGDFYLNSKLLKNFLDLID